ncbi:MAG TPA: methyltransferase domain-containing protein [Longimicrobiaceae bacterium]|nr:methyltransferase domain-containing protein [Longimicrobiaceae bacterium]
MSADRAGPAPSPAELRAWLGDIDVYLFDQLLKGRLATGMRVLDAGCGRGRNLAYLLRAGFQVCAVDQAPDAV